MAFDVSNNEVVLLDTSKCGLVKGNTTGFHLKMKKYIVIVLNTHNETDSNNNTITISKTMIQKLLTKSQYINKTVMKLQNE